MECCNFPRCRNESYLKYVDKNICVKHWLLLCDSVGISENKILKKIGLKRSKSGSVISLEKGDCNEC